MISKAIPSCARHTSTTSWWRSYPYEACSEAVARMAMYYELIRNGYPPVLLNLSEPEYYAAIRSYLKKEEIQPLYEPLERGVYNKLEIMMQLTAD